MKTYRYCWIFLVMIFYQIGLFAQPTTGATQLLSNYSFENKKSGQVYPGFCLPDNSGDHSIYGNPVFDYFSIIGNWTSNYVPDPIECNGYPQILYAHSPDWIGGGTSIPGCYGGWDGNFKIGIGSYEGIWQNFGAGLSEDKCYEVRIKVQPTLVAPPNQSLDVVIGTEPFWYQQPLYAFMNGSGVCEICNQDYQEYNVGPFEEYETLKRFSLVDMYNIGVNPYYPYSNGWYEVHAKIDMSTFAFTQPLGAEFYDFGLDLRDNNLSNGSCYLGDYIRLDWIEFYEACPTHYLIYGAMISGSQDDYVASNYIKAGKLDKGPAIVTSNGKTAFKAKNYIELIPGFLSDYGSVLEIVPNFTCNGCTTDDPIDPKTVSMIQHPEIMTNQGDSSRNVFSDAETQALDLKIFPNPTFGIATINYSKNIVSVEVFDNTSKSIKLMGNIIANRFDLDISDLKSGIYYILIQTVDNEIFYKKLAKI